MKISGARALSEVKMLTKRIDTVIKSLNISKTSVNNRPPAGYSSCEEFENRVKSEFQSLEDLIQRRKKIKSALIRMNATTDVVIAGDKMTIAEAIEIKNYIPVLKNRLDQVRLSFFDSIREQEYNERSVKDRFDQHFEKIAGKEKTKAEDYKNALEAFEKMNQSRILDPIDAKKWIEKEEKWIENFQLDCDVTLSEVNGRTEIEID